MIKETPIVQYGTPDQEQTTEFQVEITPKLFEMLSGLYTHKIRAVLRELICNAIDSHIDAGRPEDPVEITLPTSTFPTLIIKDYGVGMSHETVLDIYTKYSKSTKMHDSLTTGALGLGSKSPFCYTNMFVLTSIHEGTKSMYNIYINSKRIPTITLISQTVTDDENGVTVSVPVQRDDVGKFSDEMEYVASHLTSPYLVYTKVQSFESEEPSFKDVTAKYRNFYDNMQTKCGNVWLTKGHFWGNSTQSVYVLQSNVIYPVNSAEIVGELRTASISRNTVVVLECPNGSVSFSPTREELSLDMETIDYIKNELHKFKIMVSGWARYYGLRSDTQQNLDKLNERKITDYLYNKRSNVGHHATKWTWNSSTSKSNPRFVPFQYYEYSPTIQPILIKTDKLHSRPDQIGVIMYNDDTKFGDVSMTKLFDRMSQGNWGDTIPKMLIRVKTMDDLKRIIRRIKYVGPVIVRSIDLFKYQDPSIPVTRSVVMTGANVGMINNTGGIAKCKVGSVTIQDGDIVFIRYGQNYSVLYQIDADRVGNTPKRRISINENEVRSIFRSLNKISKDLMDLAVRGVQTPQSMAILDCVNSILSTNVYILTQTQYDRLKNKNGIVMGSMATVATKLVQCMSPTIIQQRTVTEGVEAILSNILELSSQYKEYVPKLFFMCRYMKVSAKKYKRQQLLLGNPDQKIVKAIQDPIIELWARLHSDEYMVYHHPSQMTIDHEDCKVWGKRPKVVYGETTINMSISHYDRRYSDTRLVSNVQRLITYTILESYRVSGKLDEYAMTLLQTLGGLNSSFITTALLKNEIDKLVDRVSVK